MIKKKAINEIEILCVETGEIRKFAGSMAVHRFMKDNTGWIVYR